VCGTSLQHTQKLGSDDQSKPGDRWTHHNLSNLIHIQWEGETDSSAHVNSLANQMWWKQY
jgi:hypothetical protein